MQTAEDRLAESAVVVESRCWSSSGDVRCDVLSRALQAGWPWQQVWCFWVRPVLIVLHPCVKGSKLSEGCFRYAVECKCSVPSWLLQAIQAVPDPLFPIFFSLQCTCFDIAGYQKLSILHLALSSGATAGRWRKLYNLLHMGNEVKWNWELCIAREMGAQEASLWEKCSMSVFQHRYRNTNSEISRKYFNSWKSWICKIFLFCFFFWNHSYI